MVELFTSTGKGFGSTIKFNASTGEEYCESTGKYNSMVELFTSTGEGFTFNSMIARFSFAWTGKCSLNVTQWSNYLPRRAKVLTQRLHAFLSSRRANVTQWANYLPQRVPQRAKVLTRRWNLSQRSNLSRAIYLNGRRFWLNDCTLFFRLDGQM